jgi:uncharacterized membrane protein
MLPPVRRPRRVTALIGDGYEGVESGVQQPAKPDALAPAAFGIGACIAAAAGLMLLLWPLPKAANT